MADSANVTADAKTNAFRVGLAEWLNRTWLVSKRRGGKPWFLQGAVSAWKNGSPIPSTLAERKLRAFFRQEKAAR